MRLVGSNLADVSEIKIKPINSKFCAVNILFSPGFMKHGFGKHGFGKHGFGKHGFGKPGFRRAKHSQLNLGLGELTLGNPGFEKTVLGVGKIRL